MNRSLAVLAVLAALVLLALIVFAIGRLRGRRPADPGAPAPRTAPAPRRTGSGSPAPREIWWAEVPFEDGTGAKDRPCLVLRVHGGTATVAKITSKHHAERPGVLALPPGTVADRQGRASWLELDELREVALGHFRRRVGPVDGQLWARVQRARSSG
ncbi:type II toxin-antitoxin system PemK/MazF family toxin [Kitasatospora sp. NBC_01266]|uniref:type II toxin-antitoxin system PemK/MazF family toxin n=1 Tax=Kitasatospora sp. NBC_01266 TaxID=2903572 RepID=UPI002E2F79B0|nr:type II toxin-antitoxin system PemK/MazF family toxin [Kitasatospora sp. NBC_01266]